MNGGVERVLFTRDSKCASKPSRGDMHKALCLRGKACVCVCVCVWEGGAVFELFVLLGFALVYKLTNTSISSFIV